MGSDALTPDLLRLFVAVCRHGSLSGAAAQVGRAQSVVSAQVARLERALGRRLLHRTGRGVVPTTDGEMLLDYARRILALGEEIDARLHERALTGVVRIGLAEDVAGSALSAALGRLRRSFPDLLLEVVVDHSVALAERWREGAFDVAVAACSTFAPDPVHSWEVELHWAIAADAAPDPARPLDVIVYAEPCDWRRLMFEALGAAARAYRIVMTCQNIGAMATAVESGVGAALLTGQSFRSDTMRPLSLANTPDPIRVRYGLYARSRPSEPVRVVRDALNASLTTIYCP